MKETRRKQTLIRDIFRNVFPFGFTVFLYGAPQSLILFLIPFLRRLLAVMITIKNRTVYSEKHTLERCSECP